jgi:acyl carrier protein
MNETEILDKLVVVFRNVLDEDGVVLRRETTAEEVPSWDSLAHVRLMVAVESEFGVRFDTDELSSLPNVGTLVDLVARKIREKG